MEKIYHYLSGFWTEHMPQFEDGLWIIIKIIILFLFARLAVTVLTRVIKKVLRLKAKVNARRRATLESLTLNITTYTIYFIFILTAFPLIGINIGALLAGAGVAGIAIAFGAQSLLKDFFNGFFILFEDQYGVGDFVKINDIWGQIESVGLRVTTIKIWTGEVEIIPNGQIGQVTNFSKDHSIAVIEINVGYDTPPEEAMSLIEIEMEKLKNEDENIIGDVEVLGVQTLNDYNYTLRATAECASYTHWEVQRAAKLRIRKAFDTFNVDKPFHKVVFLNDEMKRRGKD